MNKLEELVAELEVRKGEPGMTCEELREQIGVETEDVRTWEKQQTKDRRERIAIVVLGGIWSNPHQTKDLEEIHKDDGGDKVARIMAKAAINQANIFIEEFDKEKET